MSGLHEQRLTVSTIHAIGLPESRYSPPTPCAANLTYESIDPVVGKAT